jgi:HAD superfamily hydrolase (TIGR01509 family)
VLLDWDGTLLNSYASDTRSYLAVFRELDIKWGIKELERYYSPNWYRVYAAARIPRRDWRKANRMWRHAYAQENPVLLPEARRVLEWVRGRYELGLVTGGSRSRVRRQIQDFNLADHFSVCVCSEDTLKKKPDPAPLRLALRRLGLEPEECIYVGDAPEDIEMARRARVRAAGVLGLFPTAKRIRKERPDVLLRSIGELPGYLRSLAQG